MIVDAHHYHVEEIPMFVGYGMREVGTDSHQHNFSETPVFAGCGVRAGEVNVLSD